MRQVKVISGISGSGKSTLVRKLWNELEPGTYCKVVSADDYFMVDGEYRFDPMKIGDAHGACFRNFIKALSDDYVLVMVDNTNLHIAEIAPYMLAAQAYGWEAEILTLRCKSVEEARAVNARNSHGVPETVFMSQVRALESRELMPWWKNTDISVEGL